MYVLLFHNSRCKCSDSAPMIMSSPVKERAVIAIRAKVESHSDIADDLLAIHALSGADTVAPFHSIGKATIQYNTIQYNTIQYNTIQYNTIQYNTIQYNTIQYNTIQYNTIQYNTIQYNTI